MISVFLERTTIAALVSLAVYVVACLPYIITFNIEFSVEISFVQKIFVVSTHNRPHDVFIPFSLNIETNNFFPNPTGQLNSFRTFINFTSLFQSLASVSAYSFGNQYIMFTEQFQIGVRWDNMHEGIVTQFSFAWILTMLLLDGILYFLIGWYFHTVLNGTCLVIYQSDCEKSDFELLRNLKIQHHQMQINTLDEKIFF